MADADRLAEVRIEILGAMGDLIEHADTTVWLTDDETVFERLAYLFEVAGGDRALLVARWPEYFD
jgi:hypothetical protein